MHSSFVQSQSVCITTWKDCIKIFQIDIFLRWKTFLLKKMILLTSPVCKPLLILLLEEKNPRNAVNIRVKRRKGQIWKTCQSYSIKGKRGKRVDFGKFGKSTKFTHIYNTTHWYKRIFYNICQAEVHPYMLHIDIIEKRW